MPELLKVTKTQIVAIMGVTTGITQPPNGKISKLNEEIGSNIAEQYCP